MDDFVAEYAAGRTPNPCLRCNEKIKFEAVLDRALALGFDAVCTGHYARIDEAAGTLLRAADEGKDQSYVLAVLTRDQIAHAIFPLGDTPKVQVRAEAAQRGLLVADKPDSHDVCFIADGDTQGFLARQLGAVPGKIVDSDGAVLGAHEGAFGFTVGQRKGPAARSPGPGWQSPVRAVHRAGEQHRHRRPGRRAHGHRDHGDPPGVDGARRRRRRSGARSSCARTATSYPCVAWSAGDELFISLRAPARAVARRPGGRALRRRHRARQRHDLRRPLTSRVSGRLACRLVGLVRGLRDVPDVDDELIAVRRENHDRHAQRGSRLVEGGAST